MLYTGTTIPEDVRVATYWENMGAWKRGELNGSIEGEVMTYLLNHLSLLNPLSLI